MSDWQPIETAPKDGTRIVVYQGNGTGFYTTKGDIGIAAWGKQASPDGNLTWCEVHCCDGVTTYDHATHWMPLPSPPKTENGA